MTSFKTVFANPHAAQAVVGKAVAGACAGSLAWFLADNGFLWAITGVTGLDLLFWSLVAVFGFEGILTAVPPLSRKLRLSPVVVSTALIAVLALVMVFFIPLAHVAPSSGRLTGRLSLWGRNFNLTNNASFAYAALLGLGIGIADRNFRSMLYGLIFGMVGGLFGPGMAPPMLFTGLTIGMAFATQEDRPLRILLLVLAGLLGSLPAAGFEFLGFSGYVAHVIGGLGIGLCIAVAQESSIREKAVGTFPDTASGWHRAKHAAIAIFLVLPLLLEGISSARLLTVRMWKERINDRFMDAVVHRDIPHIRQLLDRGANPSMSLNNKSALQYAVFFEDADMIRLFLSRGAGYDERLLSEAIAQGKTPVLEILLSDGGGSVGEALLVAVERDDLRVVGLLLDHGKNNYRYPEAVKAAAERGQKEMLELLIRYPYANEMARRTVFSQALAAAMMQNQRTAITILLASGADTEVTLDNGMTPLQWAVVNGKHDIARQLLENGADPNKADEKESGWTPLHWAVERDDGDLVRMLLKFKASPNPQDAAGATPLWYAGYKQNARVIRLLRNAGGKSISPRRE